MTQVIIVLVGGLWAIAGIAAPTLARLGTCPLLGRVLSKMRVNRAS